MKIFNENQHLTYSDIEKIAKGCGNASRSGDGWICPCPCSSHGKGRGDKNPSLTISLSDDGKLLLYCHAGCSFEEILEALKKRGLISDCQNRSLFPQNPFTPQNPLSHDQKSLQEKKRKQALSIWDKALPATGTLVESYLRSRSITVRPPPSLRFHPHLEYWEQGSEGKPKLLGHFPAMIASVKRYPHDECVGIHRTYLKPDGSGKAKVSSPKKMLGNCLGGAVRFSGETLECIVVGEGIESCLSYLQFHPLLTGCAALSSSGLQNIILPPPNVTRKVIILVDHDMPGKKSAIKLAERLTQEGREIFTLMPSIEGWDMNDLLKGEAA